MIDSWEVNVCVDFLKLWILEIVRKEYFSRLSKDEEIVKSYINDIRRRMIYESFDESKPIIKWIAFPASFPPSGYEAAFAEYR